MKFLAIDFETANGNRASACEIGVVKVEGSEIIDAQSFLIRPEGHDFNPFNTSIHGINEKMVADAPTFSEVYDQLEADFNNYPIIAHNAAFDVGVLRHCLVEHDLKFPTTKYSCTYQLSKKAYKGKLLSLKLSSVCEYLGIKLEHHHRAIYDAEACANIALRIFQDGKVNEFEDISKHFGLSLGELYDGGYNASSLKNKSGSYKISDLDYDKTKANPDSPFFEMTVVFTGTLDSMNRKTAQQKILEIGGHCTSGVTKATNYLIVGEQDYLKYGTGHKSSKMKKAEGYLNAGQTIELLTEVQFLEMIQ